MSQKMEIYSSLDLTYKFMNRIGFGKDIHGLKEGVPLIIGGINIPSKIGAYSYSDGDCLTHAIIDCLLGAVGEKDIGELFKDDDSKNKNRNSISMLDEVYKTYIEDKYIISNIDTFICLEEPKLKGYKELIKENIAEHLHVSLNQISIKAGTNEGFGSVGNKEAIECYAICLLGEK